MNFRSAPPAVEDRGLPAAEPAAAEPALPGALEFLLRRLRLRSDFPAMTSSIMAINRLAASEETTSSRLASEILKDFALTNKILRLVNSAQYAQFSTTRISTISRAIVILGVDTIRSMTISLMLFDQIRDRDQASALGNEFMRAGLGALLSRELSRDALGGQAEEAYLCALFHRLGRLLAQCYFPEEAEAVRRLVSGVGEDGDDREPLDEEAAAVQVLGLGYQALGIAIARGWAFPEAMINSMQRMPPGRVPASALPQDRMRALSAFSAELGELLEATPDEGRSAAVGLLCRRYQDSIAVSVVQAQAAVVSAASGLAEMARVFHIDLAATPLGQQLSRAAVEFRPAIGPLAAKVAAAAVVADINAQPARAAALAAATSPDAEAILTRGIQDLSDALLDEGKLSDLLRIVTETLYRALAPQRVILCLRDGRSNRMQARLMLSADNSVATCGQFQFSLGPPDDLFKLILAQDVDVLIADTGDAKVRQRLPDWYVRDFNAASFLVLPLRVKGAPVAMIYIDADAPNSLQVSAKSFALLRTLRNQTVLAIRQHLQP
jgi:HD-like signal output (HDOD) protein